MAAGPRFPVLIAVMTRLPRLQSRHGARFASTITMDSAGNLKVPDDPIIPFIEGDGTGPDIWRSSVRVLDASIEKAYKGKRKIHVSMAKTTNLFHTPAAVMRCGN